MTTTNRDRLMSRLKKLKKNSEGEASVGNIEAAEAAAEMFHTLLVKYKIDEAELQDEENEEAVEERIFRWVDYGFPHRHKRNAFLERLAGVIITAHGAQMLIISRSSNFAIVSKESTYQVLTHALPILRRAATSLADKAYNKAYYRATEIEFDPGIIKDFRKNFLLGFIVRLAERFEEIKQRKHDEACKGALVVISNDLVLANDYVREKQYGKASALAPVPMTNSDAWAEGEASANSINLEGGHKKVES